MSTPRHECPHESFYLRGGDHTRCQTCGVSATDAVDDLRWRLGERGRVEGNARRELEQMAELLARPAFGLEGVDDYHHKLAEQLRKIAATLQPQ